jgi:hypothetical protein
MVMRLPFRPYGQRKPGDWLFKDSPSSPQPVDPYVQANAQLGLNQQVATLNNALSHTNTVGPNSSTSWTSQVDPAEQQRYDQALSTYNQQKTDYDKAFSDWQKQSSSSKQWVNDNPQTGVGHWQNNGFHGTFGATAPQAPTSPLASKWTQTTTLTPEQQQLFNLKQSNQNTLYKQASDQLSKPIDLSSLPGQVSSISSDFSGDRQRAEDALYKRSASRLDPQYAQTQSDLETKLYNQGVAPGTDAWQRELDNLARQKTDAYAGARNDAIAGGGQEESRLFGMGLSNAGLQNQARQTGLQELFALRQTPLQEINMLEGRTTSQPATVGGGTSGGGGVGGVDIGGAFAQQYQGQLAGANAETATNNTNTAAAASTVAAIIAAAI